MSDLDIFATADLHNRLTDEAADSIRRTSLACPDSILIDCGDAIRAGNLGFSLKGEPILRAMTQLGYACMAVGNREFHPRGGIFRKKVADAGFPLICTNIVRRSAGSSAFIPDTSVVAAAGGIKLGVIALLSRMVTDSMPTSFMSEYVFADPLEAAAAEADRLAGTVDLVVALCHTKREVAEELASQVEGIGAAVLAHVHGSGARVAWVGDVPVVSPLPYGEEMARLSLERSGDAVRVTLAETVRLAA